MNVLITGGAGFIGTHTARALHDQGHRIRVLDSLDPQIHGPGASFSAELTAIADCVCGDVRVPGDCVRALDEVDSVIHLAARTGVGQSMYDIGDYVSTNVLGTATLLEAILKSRRGLARFVLASSRAIYGEGLFRCVTHGVLRPRLRSLEALKAGDFEMHCPHCGEILEPVPTPTLSAPQPASVYALTKLQQEAYAEFAADTFGLPLVTLRYFNVYGSGQSLRNPYTGVISIFYALLRGGRSLSIYERGRPVRDFVHVADVVRANLLALAIEPGPRRVFNVGSGRMIRIADVARALGQVMGVVPQLDDRGEYRVGDIFGCVADLTESRRALGFEPQVELGEGLGEFVAWAAGQSTEDRYDVTVQELSAHGLFGRGAG